MAKIDVTKIEGYADMTPEQKLSVLEAFEFEDNLAEIERYKNSTSKASSEVAEWKRKYNALLSEDEQKKNAKEEELTTIKEELETLRKEKTVTDHKARFLTLGYDETLAGETAQAMVDGDIEKVFVNQKKFLETHEKDLKANLLKGTPKPPAGGGGEIDYQKKITEANEAGDITMAAYYTRLASQESTQN